MIPESFASTTTIPKGVSTILVYPNDPWPWKSILAGLGQPKSVGGMLLYPHRPEPRHRPCLRRRVAASRAADRKAGESRHAPPRTGVRGHRCDEHYAPPRRMKGISRW